MIFIRIVVWITTILVVLVFLVPVATAGEVQAPTAESVSEGHEGDTESVSGGHNDDAESVSEEHETAKHEFHVNHFGGFLGASTHLDIDETGFTIGLEYARQFTPRWAVVAYTELASGDTERDTIVAAGVIFYPIPGFALVVAPGVEFVSKDVEHHGELERENETEFLLRLGAGYGFPVGQASLGPVVFADRSGDRWTIVYGVGMVTGF